ncbi:hypothetical protein [Bdellovibrio sp. HCB337]|uniref:hypothetical protein n=1 Tax=Bdellovibrio sp. HCB337 TaxID=3394358 RepID=UPI0039A68A95
MSMRSFKTAKGTELPLLNLRGKEYLEVKYRLVWFREDHSDWSIETELVSVTDVSAYAKATIRDDKGRIIATSHKFESIQGFPDFIEKAETGAIGRALALIGYGTQFCADELDEGKRIVDSPATPARVQRAPFPNDRVAKPTASQEEPSEAEEGEGEETAASPETGEPGEYLVTFGRKYKGKKLREIPKPEIESYIKWLEASADKQGTPVSRQVQYLKDAYRRMYEAETSPH